MVSPGCPISVVALTAMPQISRALRSRRYAEAHAHLARIINDPDQIARTLAALIATEPKRKAWA